MVSLLGSASKIDKGDVIRFIHMLSHGIEDRYDVEILEKIQDLFSSWLKNSGEDLDYYRREMELFVRPLAEILESKPIKLFRGMTISIDEMHDEEVFVQYLLETMPYAAQSFTADRMVAAKFAGYNIEGVELMGRNGDISILIELENTGDNFFSVNKLVRKMKEAFGNYLSYTFIALAERYQDEHEYIAYRFCESEITDVIISEVFHESEYDEWWCK